MNLYNNSLYIGHMYTYVLCFYSNFKGCKLMETTKNHIVEITQLYK